VEYFTQLLSAAQLAAMSPIRLAARARRRKSRLATMPVSQSATAARVLFPCWSRSDERSTCLNRYERYTICGMFRLRAVGRPVGDKRGDRLAPMARRCWTDTVRSAGGDRPAPPTVVYQYRQRPVRGVSHAKAGRFVRSVTNSAFGSLCRQSGRHPLRVHEGSISCGGDFSGIQAQATLMVP